MSGEIGLIGFPHCLGSMREKIQSGSEYGPDCLRRFFQTNGPLINHEYNINISKMKISDYGNIEID